MLKNKTNVKLTKIPNKGLSLLRLLLVYGMLSLCQLAGAAIIVIDGDNQQISAGSDSTDIVFLVTDDEGNPNQNAKVNFNLVNALGEQTAVGLSKFLDETDDNGHVSTRFDGSGTIGSYTITATLETDTTQLVKAHLTIIAASPSQLMVSRGDHQVVPAGKESANIWFKLTDDFGNPISGKSINFELKKPSDEITSKGMFTVLANTDSNGEAINYLNVKETQGIYTIIGTLSTDSSVTTEATIQVTAPLLQGPSLGFGGAIDKEGKPIATTAIFHGGISVNGQDSNPEVVIDTDDSILIQGEIKVDSKHVGESAHLIILVDYEPLNQPPLIIMLNRDRAVQVWDGKMENLAFYYEDVDSLPETLVVDIHEGKLESVGKLRVYFGYRLMDGTIVFNANQTINIVVVF